MISPPGVWDARKWYRQIQSRDIPNHVPLFPLGNYNSNLSWTHSIHKIIYLPPFSYLNHLNFFLQTLPYSMINIDDRIWHWHLIFSDVLDDLHEHLRGHSSRLGVAGVKTTMQYRIYSEFHWWYILIYRIYSAASTTSLSQRPFPRQCEFLPDSESVFTWRRNWNRSSICPST